MKTKIPKSHPRYQSLMEREMLVEGFEKGIVVPQGLIAHGRGEAFDYIIGEKTIPPAEKAIKAAAALLLLSERPVISVNGNACALVGKDLAVISNEFNIPLEVNLFYRTEERVKKIIKELRELGGKNVLGEEVVEGIPHLESERRKVSPDGILKADTVMVLLEDGDRTEALKKMNKKVIAVDLNPFSRTALMADITIVDNVTRAIPLLRKFLKEFSKKDKSYLQEITKTYNNNSVLAESILYIKDRLIELASRLKEK